MGAISTRIAIFFFTLTFFFSYSIAPVLATVTYLYDANGNMTSDGEHCYTYNEANKLTRVKNCSNNQTIAEYVYDYKGNRKIKKEYQSGSLLRTIYSPEDGYETVKLASNGATQNTSYFFANDQLIAKKDPSGNKLYYHNDHLGSTGIISNQSGTVVEETTYDPWGEVKTGGTKSKFLYTGQERDLETNLHYYNARYYDPHIKRFIQADPILGDIFDPQILNRYSYVRNNPVRYTDPTGHCIGPLILACANLIIAGTVISTNINPIITFVSNSIKTYRKDPTPKTAALITFDVATNIIPGGKAGGPIVKKTADILNKSEAVGKAGELLSKPFTSNNFRQNLGKSTGEIKKGYDAHHVFPQKFRSTFEELGIKNIDDPLYGAWWEKSSHRRNAYEYNQKWEEFLRPKSSQNDVTNESILDFGRTIMGEYGLKTRF